MYTLLVKIFKKKTVIVTLNLISKECFGYFMSQTN